ncbi:MAG: aldo/keto reductase [Candidatus Methanoperedens sp.]
MNIEHSFHDLSRLTADFHLKLNTMFSSHLVLGTAQLGLTYGVANRTGQPDQKMATSIIAEAWKCGIREFDTAQGYGISEMVLGKALSELRISSQARVISKFDPHLDHLNAMILSDSLDKSLEQLGIQNLYGIMLHREEMLSFWNQGISIILNNIVQSGRASHIGVAVYSPEKAIQALNLEGIDMVQIPTNILDRRFEDAGVYELAERKKKQLYIRSIFLQGLILMGLEEIPEKLSFAKPIIEKIDMLSRDFNLSRSEIAMGYLKAQMPNAHVMFGAETPIQVKNNTDAWQKEIPESFCRQIRMTFADETERLLNPVLWPQ